MASAIPVISSTISQGAALLLFGPVLQRSAVDEFGDQILAAFKFSDIVNGQDMRMIERRGELRLPLETPSRRGIRHFLMQEFDRHRTAELGVDRAINHAHPAFTQFFLQTIMIKRLRRGLPDESLPGFRLVG